MNRFDASVLWRTESQDPTKSGDPKGSDPDFESANDDSDSFENIEELTEELDRNDFSGVDSSSDDITDADLPTEKKSWVSASAAQTFFVPMHYEQKYRYPIVVWLHSDGYNENQVLHVMPHISQRNYIATGIRGPKSADAAGHRFQWSTSPTAMDVAEEQVFRAVERVANQYNIHSDRVVLAGYQTGGSMAMQIAVRNPDHFAAAVSIGGAFELPSAESIDLPKLRQRRLPMLWQHAMPGDNYDEDALVQQVSAAAAIKAQVEMRYYRTDDEMNTEVLSDTDRWIMDQVVASPTAATMTCWNSSPTMFSDN